MLSLNQLTFTNMDATKWLKDNEQDLKGLVAGVIRLELGLDFTQPEKTVSVLPEQAKSLASAIVDVVRIESEKSA